MLYLSAPGDALLDSKVDLSVGDLPVHLKIIRALLLVLVYDKHGHSNDHHHEKDAHRHHHVQYGVVSTWEGLLGHTCYYTRVAMGTVISVDSWATIGGGNACEP